MSEKIYIGVDLGKSGGIAILSTNSGPQLHVMPTINKEVDYQALCRLLKDHISEVHVIFERLQATPMVPKHTCISMGWQAGAIEGICVALQLSYTMIHPKTWQKKMFEGTPDMKRSDGKNDTKGRALVAAQRLFPSLSFLMTERSSKPHEGVVDALLMARYAQKQNL